MTCTGKKKPKKEKINDAWKDYFKTWGQWNNQSLRGSAPGPHNGGSQCPIWTSSCNGQHANARWVMA